MNQNDVKKLLKNKNLDEVIQEVSEEKLENDQFFDSSEEIKQLIDNEISVNDKIKQSRMLLKKIMTKLKKQIMTY